MVLTQTTVPVQYLCTVQIQLQQPKGIRRGPLGTRFILGVAAGSVQGPQLTGTVEPPGVDWVTAREDGSVQHDGRLVLTTNDGAIILVTYTGIGIAGQGYTSVRAAVQLETGEPRYAWLNDVQAVAIGESRGRGLVLDLYALT